jgi:hypothetical protein
MLSLWWPGLIPAILLGGYWAYASVSWRNVLCVALICMGACTTEIDEIINPITTPPWTPPTNPRVDAPRNADAAAKLVWHLLGGDEDRLPHINWVGEGPYLKGLDDPTCCSGFYKYWSESDTHEIWCTVFPRLTDSALVHELTHAILQDTEGGPNGTGEEDCYPGEYHNGPAWCDVPEITEQLISVGLI